MKILIGTKNKHKASEISAILSRSGIGIILPDDIGGLPEVEESGESFEENAALKAIAYAKFASSARGSTENVMAIADDSGLEVEALGGAPGIYSSRYESDDGKRISKLISELNRVNSGETTPNRAAKFVCVVALADPEGLIKTFRGEVHGVITEGPKGSNGFGYDPVFRPNGHEMTFAELASETKNQISHRANALRKFEKHLTEMPKG
ncbi:MAG TPA: RdgB/HAM1 family non-canonical purine NTP pyrophosphatase [Victivallales bacterium]|nr:RdgB/HAM1 family non-canonical purine NTP pyrophosphatase [Victivallales bacterium]